MMAGGMIDGVAGGVVDDVGCGFDRRVLYSHPTTHLPWSKLIHTEFGGFFDFLLPSFI